MLGLDTNVLVRYIVRDDPRQTEAATRFIESRCTEASPGFVSQLVLAELSWVLTHGYGYAKPVLLQVVTKMLHAIELQVEDAQEVWRAVRAYESGGADFADYLIGRRAIAFACETTFTFDQKAAKTQLHTLVPEEDA